MENVAARFAFLYDPVFLEFARRFRRGDWGSPRGASFHFALPDRGAEAQALAFLYLLLGRPRAALRVERGPVSTSTLLFGDFAATADCVLAPAAALASLPNGTAVAATFSFGAAEVECRLGADRTLAYARGEGPRVEASRAEGDGARYRLMDVERCVANDAADAEALLFAEELLVRGTFGGEP